MAFWLLKSEPDVFGWNDLVRDGQGFWDGVRNYQARNNLLAMRVGDEGLFYHSNLGKACVGVVRVAAEAVPDPTVRPQELTKDGRNPWVGVTMVPVKALVRPVTLAQVKATPSLAQMALLTTARLSVQPVRAAEWQMIMRLAEAPGI
jgi:predicted RNA-binding protein with PUA-like domain